MHEGRIGSCPLSVCTASSPNLSRRPCSPLMETCLSLAHTLQGTSFFPRVPESPLLIAQTPLKKSEPLQKFQLTSQYSITTRTRLVPSWPLGCPSLSPSHLVRPTLNSSSPPKPSPSPSSTCRLSESARQKAGVSLEPSLPLPHPTVYQSRAHSPKSAWSPPVHCRLLLESPSSLSQDRQGVKPQPQTCLEGLSLLSPAPCWPQLLPLSRSLTRLQPGGISCDSHHTVLYVVSKPLHSPIPSPDTSLPHCFPPS